MTPVRFASSITIRCIGIIGILWAAGTSAETPVPVAPNPSESAAAPAPAASISGEPVRVCVLPQNGCDCLGTVDADERDERSGEAAPTGRRKRLLPRPGKDLFEQMKERDSFGLENQKSAARILLRSGYVLVKKEHEAHLTLWVYLHVQQDVTEHYDVRYGPGHPTGETRRTRVFLRAYARRPFRLGQAHACGQNWNPQQGWKVEMTLTPPEKQAKTPAQEFFSDQDDEQREEEFQQLVSALLQEPGLKEHVLAEISADEEAWAAADVPGCEAGRTMTSCSGISSYRENRGGHKSAVTRLLALAQDEDDWKNLRINSCRTPSASTDCDSLKRYLTEHRVLDVGRVVHSHEIVTVDGQTLARAHSRDAEAVIAASEKRIEALRSSEAKSRRTQELISRTCRVDRQLAELSKFDRMQRRIDQASGTIDLAQRRKIGTTRVYLEDERKQYVAELVTLGTRFNVKDCNARMQ